MIKIIKIAYIDSQRLYRDNGLMVMLGNRRVNNRIKKQHFKILKYFEFEIEVDTNKKVQYLDVKFNLLAVCPHT